MQPEQKCTYPDHDGYPIAFICIDRNCDQTRWACLGCKLVLHYYHKIISLMGFMKFVEERNNKLNTLKSNFANIEEKVRNAGDCLRRINLLNENLFQQLTLGQLNMEIKNLVYFNTYENNLVEASEELFDKVQKLEKQLHFLSDVWIEILKQGYQNEGLNQSSENIFNQTMRQNTSRQFPKNNSDVPASELLQPQHPKLKFINNPNKSIDLRTLSNVKQANGTGFILCEPKLQENQFDMILELGLVRKQSQKFLIFSRIQVKQVMGKLVYLIQSLFFTRNGFAFSHHDKNQNNTLIKTSHLDLQKIYMVINFKSKEIRWLDEFKNEIQKMTIELLSTFHVVAELVEGEVEIINL